MRKRTGRTMMPLDEQYLAQLKGFKSGFTGNELWLLKEILGNEFSRNSKTVKILDVGSGDGMWLAKMARFFQDLDLNLQYTAVEPLENASLIRVANEFDIEVRQICLEECGDVQNKYDAVIATQSAYYFYNEGWAHTNIRQMLKPGGIYVVTLASDSCILHEVTEFLLDGGLQKVFTAESYLRHVAKLGLFEIAAIRRLEGEFDWEHYLKDNDALESLAHVLSRHRLTATDLKSRTAALPEFLKANCGGRKRVNRVMVFRNRTDVLGKIQDDIKPRAKRVFISHSSKQKSLAADLHFMLEQAGFNPTLDSIDINGGEELTDSIKSLIESCDYFVVLISEESISSKWVQTEIALAESTGLLKSQRIIPVQVGSIASDTANSIPVIPKGRYKWIDGTKGIREVVNRLLELESHPKT